MKSLCMEELRRFEVPPGALTLWWLGQAGFLVKSPAGKLVAVDPYLSNSCKAIGDQYGYDMDRLLPAPISPSQLVGIDLYAITHSHQDHLDPETIEPYRAAGGTGPFVAPAESIEKLHTMGIPEDETVMIWPNKNHTVGDLTLRATLAIPLAGDDLTHIGYLISIEDGPTAYITGDTGSHEVLATSVADHKPDVLVVVINGTFRNMGPAEAAELAKRINARVVIPCHYDLFPANQVPPELLRSNMQLLGIAEKYRLLEHGVPFTFSGAAPEDTGNVG